MLRVDLLWPTRELLSLGLLCLRMLRVDLLWLTRELLGLRMLRVERLGLRILLVERLRLERLRLVLGCLGRGLRGVGTLEAHTGRLSRAAFWSVGPGTGLPHTFGRLRTAWRSPLVVRRPSRSTTTLS
jgi:hypothetical protein